MMPQMNITDVITIVSCVDEMKLRPMRHQTIHGSVREANVLNH